jgi:hypothetical protein
MLLAIGCEQQTSEQIVEKVGRDHWKKIEKKVTPRIRDMVVRRLKYPESYQPISTDITVVNTKMLIYDSQAFVALRDLDRALKTFNEMHGNDTTSQEARIEMANIKNLTNFVHDKDNTIRKLPLEFAGIDVYHQFYADDKPGHQVKKGYHFIVHKDNNITLLCDNDELLRVKAFATEFLKNPPYRIK